jgi:prevent-host-death family protein
MTKSVGVHEAKTHLSRLLDDVAAGEEVVITRRGEEIATLVPRHAQARRKFGTERGRLVVPDDFDDPLPQDLLDAFEGR